VPAPNESLLKQYFTDFDGRFKGRLSHIRPTFAREAFRESAGVRAKHTGIIKVEYQKDLMGLLEEGMLLAVRNYKGLHERRPRFTLLEVAAIWPSHFGLSGLSEESYYPLQFEIIQQSVEDWDASDTSTLMIRMSAIPINYDLSLDPEKGPSFDRGFSYPIPAEEAFILNRDLINLMYNKRVIERIGGVPAKTSSEARRDPRLGLLKMFEAVQHDIPLYIDFERLVRYHFGLFSFTGGVKSNLASNIMRRLLYHTKDVKIVIFDIACEYPFLLLDVLSDPKIPAHVIFENRVTDASQLVSSIVRPRDYEEDPRVLAKLGGLVRRGILGHLVRHGVSPAHTYGSVLNDLEDLKEQSEGRPTYLNAISLIEQQINNYLAEHGCSEDDTVTKEFVDFLNQTAQDAVERFRVSDKSQLWGWATTRSKAMQLSPTAEAAPTQPARADDGYTVEAIQHLIEGEDRLMCLSIADPSLIKMLVSRLTSQLLLARTKRFQVKPYILFVFDEAQEFIPLEARGLDRTSSYHVERLLRQGRKYGLGACIATQRVAHLNTSCLQQLHTFFVGTLPRPYDRSVVSSTFLIDEGILEKTLEFGPGEWLLASYTATGIENVPIFLRADNAEKEIEAFLAK
jgi:hypothetical protein